MHCAMRYVMHYVMHYVLHQVAKLRVELDAERHLRRDLQQEASRFRSVRPTHGIPTDPLSAGRKRGGVGGAALTADLAAGRLAVHACTGPG